ncbi:mobile element protein [Streptomyces axinellae]|uniref:Mobile element protein n=1 Tax=Streptomyces axinellae TaxID=552788 RepID=A0ABP6CWB8_9ACTN
MPTTSPLLASPDDLAAWLGVPADDPKLMQALNAASSRFRGAVRHHVTPVVDDIAVLDGNGRRAVLLRAAPVTAVASVALDGEPLTEDDYEWSADGFLRRMCGCWPDRLRCIRVVYTHGYEPVPEDIAEVVLDQARAQFTVVPGLTSMTVGGQTLAFGAQASIGVTAQWTSVVERYRLNAGDQP